MSKILNYLFNDHVICPFLLFLLAIVLSVLLLLYMDSDYPFGIFKLFSQSSPLLVSLQYLAEKYGSSFFGNH
jgi:hypothetical protein